LDRFALYLYVPWDRWDRIEKASASDADAVLIDLEGAVASAAKDLARDDDEWKGCDAFASLGFSVDRSVRMQLELVGRQFCGFALDRRLHQKERAITWRPL
jgi:hypothetical protein